MLAARTDQPEHRGVEEGRRAADTENHVVVVGHAEQVAYPAAYATDDVAYGGLAMGGSEKVRTRAGQCVDRFASDLGRSGSEASVGGNQVGRDADVRRRHGPIVTASYSVVGPAPVPPPISGRE